MYLTLKLEVFPAGLLPHAGEHAPCPKVLYGCIFLKNRHCWHCLLVSDYKSADVEQGVLMHIKSSLPLLTHFEVGSIFFRL